MMKNRRDLTQRDLELLSAYIDDQLNERQSRAIEKRLKQESDLRRALAELRTTVHALRDLPAPRPARHFTLTPEMAGIQQDRRAIPVLRFATALAGLAFVVLVGVEGLLTVSGPQMASRAPVAMQQAEQAQDAVSGLEEPMAAAPAEAPPEMEALEMPAEEAREGEPEALMMEEPQLSDEAPAGEDQVGKISDTPEPTLEPVTSEGAQAEGRTSAAEEAELADEQTAPAPLQGLTTAETPPSFAAGEEQPKQNAVLSPLRWLQVISGALFIVLSVLTVTFRRQSR